MPGSVHRAIVEEGGSLRCTVEDSLQGPVGWGAVAMSVPPARWTREFTHVIMYCADAEEYAREGRKFTGPSAWGRRFELCRVHCTRSGEDSNVRVLL